MGLVSRVFTEDCNFFIAFFRDYENQSEEPSTGWFSALASMVNSKSNQIRPTNTHC